VTEIPRSAFGRTARLAALPLGFAGRAAVGFGKRVTGIATEVISEEVQQRTAEHLFKVLGQLKGGAMKMGQAMSVFEAAMPEELAGPYRAALTKLQEAAPALPAALPRFRGHPGRGGQHRAGAPGDLARRSAGRCQDPVPGSR
jgi:predicted unusual protein kinase regulating ubiquinone biosynthesis (AarF/ABC1/UbiB family)